MCNRTFLREDHTIELNDLIGAMALHCLRAVQVELVHTAMWNLDFKKVLRNYILLAFLHSFPPMQPSSSGRHR